MGFDETIDGENRSTHERKRPVTMADVAELAMVSYQTVSRVLHDNPNVHNATRARVQAAVIQLGYRPNSAARALATGRSMTLGIVALDTPTSSGLPGMYGIERKAREEGFFVSVASLGEISSASVRKATERLVGQGVDGLLVIAPVYSANEALADIASDMPLVVVEGDPETDVATVTVDQVSGAEDATRHLLSGGPETVFHIAGPRDWRQSDERILGWRRALESARAEVTVPLSGDWSAKSGYELGNIIAQVPGMTAAFIANDQMALGVICALQERGRRVPDDVVIVGFDDIPEAAYFNPSLSTVRQDRTAVGARALDLLLRQIESGTRSSEKVYVECELIIRESSRTTGKQS